MCNNNEEFQFTGQVGNLSIPKGDEASKKLAMLIEVKCCGLSPTKTAQKYGYTKQRYYQILKDYNSGGVQSLIDKKSGPKKNYVRTYTLENQIIRYRFLDHDCSPAVIAQKLKQDGYKISIRSVERTITKFGLQKKTLLIQSGKGKKSDRGSSN